MAASLLDPETQTSLLELAKEWEANPETKDFWHAARRFMKTNSDALGLLQMGTQTLEWDESHMQTYFAGKLQSELITALFKSMDGNKDGIVKLTSFNVWLEGKVTKDEVVEAIDEVWLMKQLKGLDMSALDADGDHRIQREELMSYFAESGIESDVVDNVFDVIDLNGDGEISALEFFRWRAGAALDDFKDIVRKTTVDRVARRMTAALSQVDAPPASVVEEPEELVVVEMDGFPDDEPTGDGPVEEEPVVEDKPVEDAPEEDAKEEATEPVEVAEEDDAPEEEDTKEEATEPADATEELKKEAIEMPAVQEQITDIVKEEPAAESAPVEDAVVNPQITDAVVEAPAEEPAVEQSEDVKEEAVTESAPAEEPKKKKKKKRVSKPVKKAKMVFVKAHFEQKVPKLELEVYFKEKGLSEDEITQAFELAAAEWSS